MTAIALVLLVVFGVFMWFQLKPFLNRTITLAETRAEVARPKVLEGKPMPAGLYAFAMGESEEWAREDHVKRMYEMYAECADWTQVQNQMLIREARERSIS